VVVRIPVVYQGRPLMPTRLGRAKYWVEIGKARCRIPSERMETV